ncbi:MAG: AAA family ATPase, partial [Gammaproteobacteria bacterium]|nr:AAA family ATPase [Gammaproteobacteria bacterium]
MAYLVPSDLSQLHLSDPHNPEIRVLHMLKRELPNDYTVFHGVHWSREHAQKTHFGEIDFVILNRAGKVLMIEQKNGRLEETDEGLVKRYADGEKNPVQQIHRSMAEVREKFKRQGNSRRLEVDYLIYCPDHKVTKVNAAGVDMQRIVDADSKDQLATRIGEVLEKGEKTTDRQYQQVIGFFNQTFNLVPDIHSHIESQATRFKRQIGDHAKILMDLDMHPFRLKISGTAGSGKSQFARQFFDRELANNRKILLLCFNRPLSDQLKAGIGTSGKVNTFYGFCDEFLDSVGKTLEYENMKSDPDFWKEVMDLIMNFEITDGWKYDSLVIDEGQDFQSGWLEIIRLFLQDDANILWLEDRDQNLYGNPPVKLDDLFDSPFVGYPYHVNYRSPETIAKFIQQTLPFEFERGNSLPGLEVKVHEY